MSYFENRPALVDVESDSEICVRVGGECDNGSEAVDVRIRVREEQSVMRVSVEAWRAFVRAVARAV